VLGDRLSSNENIESCGYPLGGEGSRQKFGGAMFWMWGVTIVGKKRGAPGKRLPPTRSRGAVISTGKILSLRR